LLAVRLAGQARHGLDATFMQDDAHAYRQVLPSDDIHNMPIE